MSAIVDQDAIVAVADLVGRTGAREFEIGYLHDDVPVDRAGWYAHAQYRGARITVEDCAGPTEAADGLARRLLDGATCIHCKLPVVLADRPNTIACRWTRMGSRWTRGCE